MHNGKLLTVAYGLGRDSTAVLVGLWQRGIRPDLIIFADVGAERGPTYAYLPVINAWLRSVGFPEITVVRYEPTNFKHWPHYHSIEENILTNVSLPSIAYGGHSCSSKWKITPQLKYVEKWQPAIDAWARGEKILKAVGFEDSPHEHKRAERGCSTFAVSDIETTKYELWFPLQEWGWNLARCIEEIAKVGLPVPPKSSCYFCTAMKPWEVDELAQIDPEKLRRIVIIEARTRDRHINYVIEKRAELLRLLADPNLPDRTATEAALKRLPPDGQPATEGIWRKAVKGMRGATKRPGSMTQYIREKGLLPSAEIDALILATPTTYATAESFEAQGIVSWQDWLDRVIAAAVATPGTDEQTPVEKAIAAAA